MYYSATHIFVCSNINIEKHLKYQKFLKNINLLYLKYINDITFAFKMENKNIQKNINMYFFPFEGEGYAFYIFLNKEDLYLLKNI